MTFPNWLDTREDVTFEEAQMREIHYPVDKYVDLPLAVCEDQALAEQEHWEDDPDYLALYFDMGDEDHDL